MDEIRPKTGRERKTRRRAKKAETVAIETNAHNMGHWDGGTRDQLLLGRALKKRWFTDATAEQVRQLLESKAMTIREMAIGIIRRGMLNEDPAVMQKAVTNLLRMEEQNQRDEHKTLPDKLEVDLVTPEERMNLVLERISAEMARRGISVNGSKST